jgi:hypothetical protein
MATQQQLENTINLLSKAISGDTNATESQTASRQSSLEKARLDLEKLVATPAPTPVSAMGETPAPALDADVATPDLTAPESALPTPPALDEAAPAIDFKAMEDGMSFDTLDIGTLLSTNLGDYSKEQIEAVMQSNNGLFFNKTTGEFTDKFGVTLEESSKAAVDKAVQEARLGQKEAAPAEVLPEAPTPEGEAIAPPIDAASEKEQVEIAELEQQVGDSIGAEHVDEARDAMNDGVLSQEEYRSYLEAKAPSAETKLVEAVTPTFETPPAVVMANELSAVGDMNFSSLSGMITSVIGDQDLSEMSSAAVNQIMLAEMAIGMAEGQQQSLSDLYGRMAIRTEEAYLSTLDAVGTATSEIDAIISGASEVATSISALQVKVAKQQQDLGVASTEALEGALNAEYEFTFNQMLEQNSRLEGYMKAKLNYMGASDSSAGLTTMSLAIDNAQQRLMLYQTKHSAEMVELEGIKTGLMNDYYNAVTSNLIQLQSAEGEALATYNTSLDTIEANQLASEAESQTMMLNTLSGLTNSLYTLEIDQRNWEYQVANDLYNRAVQESAIARDIENQEKAVALDFLDRLISSGAGGTFADLPADMQQSIMDLTAVVGLPSSYAEQSLQTIRNSMAGPRGPGGPAGPYTDADGAVWNFDAEFVSAYEAITSDMALGETFAEAVTPWATTANRPAFAAQYTAYQQFLSTQGGGGTAAAQEGFGGIVPFLQDSGGDSASIQQIAASQGISQNAAADIFYSAQGTSPGAFQTLLHGTQGAAQRAQEEQARSQAIVDSVLTP